MTSGLASGTRLARGARRVRAWLAARSIRARLLVGALLLCAVGLVSAEVVCTQLFRGYLMDRTDDQARVLQNRLGLLEVLAPRVNRIPDDLRSVLVRTGAVGTHAVVEFRDASGRTQLRFSTSDESAPPPELPPARSTPVDEPFTTGTSDPDDGQRYRVLVRERPGGGTVAAAIDLNPLNDTTRRLIRIEIIVTAVVLTGLALLGSAVVRIGLKPLADVEATAEAIIDGDDLSRRVPERAPPTTEIGRLSATLNTMLGRIDQSFAESSAAQERLRRFVADAGHELRTPLAAVLGLVELHRSGAASGAGQDRAGAKGAAGAKEAPRAEEFAGAQDITALLDGIEAEGRRMRLLVEDLLLLARLDQERPQASEPVDLVPLAVDALATARATEPDRPLRLDLPPGDEDDGPQPTVVGDDVRLARVLTNLVSNALRHTPSGTPVALRIGTDEAAGQAVVEVADAGPGVPPEEAERIFDRFHRVGDGRDRASGGTGLGLSIVAAIVTAHGGTVRCLPTPGGGATFEVRLPLRESAS
ncbi:HAMP domain-containing sensor histidine kinase [Streptomyces sp. NPDC047108]|uniref:sensor histidine kinase n=1 Tax=Streptomyces sp. NPDC047108 TaxID=3155025 RepID=UPI0033F666FA